MYRSGMRTKGVVMYQRIIVGLDGSASAEEALVPAAAVAQRASAEIRLVHVLDVLQSGYVNAISPASWSSDYPGHNAREYLERLARRLSAQRRLNVTVDVLKGDAADELVKVADRPASDLLMLTSHGRGPLQRFWLGSVADRVMREATPPVMLVPSGIASHGNAPFTNVLAPLDGSELAERALYGAATLADLFGAKLTLLRIVEIAPDVATVAIGPGIFPVQLVETKTLERAASNYLSDVASAYKVLAPVVNTVVIVDAASPASSILKYAADHGVDLIALATHGEGGMRRLILGSVADKLIRAGQFPVLVHKSQEQGAIPRPIPMMVGNQSSHRWP